MESSPDVAGVYLFYFISITMTLGEHYHLLHGIPKSLHHPLSSKAPLHPRTPVIVLKCVPPHAASLLTALLWYLGYNNIHSCPRPTSLSRDFLPPPLSASALLLSPAALHPCWLFFCRCCSNIASLHFLLPGTLSGRSGLPFPNTATSSSNRDHHGWNGFPTAQLLSTRLIHLGNYMEIIFLFPCQLSLKSHCSVCDTKVGIFHVEHYVFSSEAIPSYNLLVCWMN